MAHTAGTDNEALLLDSLWLSEVAAHACAACTCPHLFMCVGQVGQHTYFWQGRTDVDPAFCNCCLSSLQVAAPVRDGPLCIRPGRLQESCTAGVP
jgi:hypothetical protein